MAVVRLEVHQSAQRAQAGGLVVDQLGVFLERRVAAAPGGVLERGYGQRVEEVLLALDAVLDVATDAELLVVDRPLGRIGPILAHLHFARDDVYADAADPGWRAGEVLVDEVRVEPDGLEDLRAVVALDGADAHLGDDLDDPLGDRLAVLLFGDLGGARNHAQTDLVVDRLEGKIRVDRAGAVAEEHGEVMDFARFARLQDEAGLGSGAGPDQVVVNRRDGQQGRDRGHGGVVAAVREDDDVVALGDRLGAAVPELLDGLSQPGSAVGHAP